MKWKLNVPGFNDVIVNPPQASDPVGPDGGKNADELEEVDCIDDNDDGDEEFDPIRLDEQIRPQFYLAIMLCFYLDSFCTVKEARDMNRDLTEVFWP